MVAQIAVEDTEEDEEIFDCSYRCLEELKRIFIRAAIAYLSDLSAKNLSKALLVDEGILDAHAATQIDEAVAITNYRLRIDAASRLVMGSLIWQWLSSQKVEKPVLVEDSILGPDSPDVQRILGSLKAMNLPYRMERIPKTMPPVLSELSLKGLHHYVAHDISFSYGQSQDIVAFLDKMKPYLKFGPRWGTQDEPVDERLRTVFIGCEQGGRVRIG